MVKGAIELTPSGLVVLGPDHPTTGGYPVVGVLRDRAMDAFYNLPVGASVHFTTE
jgi:allophanate hydrolase subunit 2